jgi:hypothetical protein
MHMKSLSYVAVLLLTSFAVAQSVPEATGVATDRQPPVTDGITILPMPPMPNETNAADVITSEFAKNVVMPARKTANRAFWKLNGLSAATTVADIGMTARCVAIGTCREANPLFGSFPGAGRLFGISLPMMGAQVAASYYLKKHNNKAWKASPVVSILAHGLGVASNVPHF